MKAEDVSRLVEFSEARAYESLLTALPPERRQGLGIGATRAGTAITVFARPVSSTLNMNRVIGLGVAEPATESALTEICEFYGSSGSAFGIEVSPLAQPRELRDWLKWRRIRRGTATAMHYRRSEAMEVVTQGFSVGRAPLAQRDVVAHICCEVFRMPDPVRSIISATAQVTEWRQWLAYKDGDPIAAALSYVRDGVAWLGWDATKPDFRGQGVQLALIACRLNDAVASGCQYATTETGTNTNAYADPSYRNYARMGFSLAYERTTYVRLRSAEA
jgi:hypothetical protein